jgi:hypothetical protein
VLSSGLYAPNGILTEYSSAETKLKEIPRDITDIIMIRNRIFFIMKYDCFVIQLNINY